MKKTLSVLITLLLVISCLNKKEEKKKISFINEAVAKAKTGNRILIIEFWAPECGPCMKLKRDIFENAENQEFLKKNYFLVQVSPADSIYKLLWSYFKLSFQSSIIFMDHNANEIDRTVGYDGDKDTYLNFLKDFAQGGNQYANILSAYKKDSLNVINNYKLAKKLYLRYQLKDAIKYFNNVILYDSNDKYGFNPECKYRIAESELILTGSIDKMLEYIKTDVKNEYVPKAYSYLGNNLFNKKDTLGCLSIFKEALTKYPENPDILNDFAWTIYSFNIKKDFNNAFEMVQKAISINPNDPNYLDTQAWLYFALGDREKAIQSEEKAIELHPLPGYKAALDKFKFTKK